MKKVALYCRVSSIRQETENQLSILREVCSKAGDRIVREYVEKITAGGTKVRDEFQAMLEDARRKRFDLVLFWALDRFSREGALKTLQHLEKLSGYGVGWRSHTEQYLDSAGIFKDAIIAIIATLAKQERLRIQERIRAGLARARREGKRFGRPVAPVNFSEASRMVEQGVTIYRIAKHYGCSRSSVRRALARGQRPVSDG